MNANYFYVKIDPMVTISETTYKNLARLLIAEIGESDYYNGSVEYVCEEFDSLFRASLIIYRRPALDPADPTYSATQIIDIIPVWWECHTVIESEIANNDFSWRDFKEYIL